MLWAILFFIRRFKTKDEILRKSDNSLARFSSESHSPADWLAKGSEDPQTSVLGAVAVLAAGDAKALLHASPSSPAPADPEPPLLKSNQLSCLAVGNRGHDQ